MTRIIATLMLAIPMALGTPAFATTQTSAARTSRQSGTVAAIDPVAHTITLDEMGPWLGPTTAPTRHAIALTRSTRVELVTRATQPAPGGWPGGYVDSSLSAADVRPGDFVTVEVIQEDGRAVATAIDVVRRT